MQAPVHLRHSCYSQSSLVKFSMAPTPATLILYASSLLTPSQTVFPPKLALLHSKLKSSLYHKALKSSLKKTEKGQEFLHQVREQHATMAKFAYNNHIHSSTWHMPFFVNTGQHPCMGFEPVQLPTKVEAVWEFGNCMKDTLSEAQAALVKSKNDMAHYYNQHCMPAPTLAAVDKVFLDASDICMTHSSKKLSHHFFGPFPVVHPVGLHTYHLWLPPSMSYIHPVFHVVKLMLVPEDPIGWWVCSPPALTVIGGEQHYEVKSILDSRLRAGKLEFLVNWKGYGYEKNSWVSKHNVNAPQLISQFYCNHPGAHHHICAIHFASMNFHAGLPTPWFCCSQVDVSLKGGWCKGNSQIQYSNSATHVTLVIPVTLCNHPSKKSHQVAAPIDHSVCVTHCLPFPFLFLCLAIVILLYLHLVSHTISNTFCISYSPLISLLWPAAGCYALCSLCSPPLLGESLEFSLWIPLARIWVLCLIIRLPLHYCFRHNHHCDGKTGKGASSSHTETDESSNREAFKSHHVQWCVVGHALHFLHQISKKPIKSLIQWNHHACCRLHEGQPNSGWWRCNWDIWWQGWL